MYLGQTELSEIKLFWLTLCIAQSDVAVEYTDGTSTEGVRPPPNEYSGKDTKQSDGEVPGMPELWGMQSAASLLWIQRPFWPGMEAPDLWVKRTAYLS